MKRLGAMLLVAVALAFSFSGGAVAEFNKDTMTTPALVQTEILAQMAAQDRPAVPPSTQGLTAILTKARHDGITDRLLAAAVDLMYPNVDSEGRREAQQALIDAGSRITIVATGTSPEGFSLATGTAGLVDGVPKGGGFIIRSVSPN